MPKILLRFFVSLLLVFLILPASATAQTDEEQILSFNEKIIINQDSTINVNEEIKYNFPSARHGIYRDIPYRYKDSSNNKNFLTPISNISVTDEKDNPYQYSGDYSGDYLNIKIGDPDKTITGEHIYKISYKVAGVINYFTNYDELYWNANGNDWEVPINNVKVDVSLPVGVDQNALQKKCYTGLTGSTEENCSSNISSNTITYTAVKGPLTIVAGWNKGTVAVISRQYERVWRHESGWFWFIPLFALIILLILYFRNGRDPAGRKTIAPEFEPPDKMTPAEIGALFDERASNPEITATIIDLAVRKYLKIRHENKKYTLIKLKDADANLRNYEKDILDGIFGSKKEIKLGDIHTNFSNEKNKIEDAIYTELVKRRYFLENPDNIRGRYYLTGILFMIFCGIFFWLSWHLVFALAFSGIFILIFARVMPRKTREGVIAKEKSLGFKEFLFRAERYRIHWQEKESIFEKYLPYAMVFGIAKIWAKNFEGIYKNPPSWYQGDFTTFSTVVLANELSSFSTTANASYSPPAVSGGSGFSGGSSGGGFGGGGGGSW